MSTPSNVVRRLPVVAAVEARLDEQVSSDTSDTTFGYLGKPVNVPHLDEGGHVHRYWVLHPFAGTPSLEQDLAQTAVDLEWTFQVTCVAAFPRDALAVFQAVDAALYRWRPQVPGLVLGRLTPPEGYDPGTVREDPQFKPSRFWLPAQYRTTITRS